MRKPIYWSVIALLIASGARANEFAAYVETATREAAFVALWLTPSNVPHEHTLAYSVTTNAEITAVQLPGGSADAAGFGRIVVSDTVAGMLQYDAKQFTIVVHFASGTSASARLQRAWYLPAVGHVRGVGGSLFTTRISIVEEGMSSPEVKIAYFEGSASGGMLPDVRSFGSVPPAGQITVEPFGHDENTIGAAIIMAGQHSDVVAEIVETAADGGGEFGFAYMPFLPRTVGTLPALRQASQSDFTAGRGKRTNLGFFNPDARAIAVNLQARDASGSLLAIAQIALGPYQQLLTSAPALFGSAVDGKDFYVNWFAQSRTHRIFGYASVVDNRTHDSVFIAQR